MNRLEFIIEEGVGVRKLVEKSRKTYNKKECFNCKWGQYEGGCEGVRRKAGVYVAGCSGPSGGVDINNNAFPYWKPKD